MNWILSKKYKETNYNKELPSLWEIVKKILKISVPESLQWVTARTSMLSVAIIRPTLSFLLCYPIGLGLLGSWIGMFIDQTIRFTVNNTRFNNLKWMKISV